MADFLPGILLTAVLLPLVSFFVILVAGNRLRENASTVATGAILLSAVLSFISFFLWIIQHNAAIFPETNSHVSQLQSTAGPLTQVSLDEHAGDHATADAAHDPAGGPGNADHGGESEKINALHGDYYLLGQFGKLRLTISYYIDTLTLCMFCMVTLIATLIHFYAQGYMHEEEDDEVVDHEVTLEEAEIFRAIADTLGCPVPPLLPGQTLIGE